MKGARVAGVLGLAYVVLVLINIIGFGGGVPPNPNATAQQLVSDYAARYRGLMIGAMFDGLGSVLLIGMIYAIARWAEPGGGIRSTLAIASAVLVSGLDLVWAAAVGASAQLAHIAAGPNSVRAEIYFSQGVLWVIGIPETVLFTTLGLLLIQSRTLPSWIGWPATVIGLLAFVGTVGTVYGSSAIIFVAYLLSLLWIVVTAIYLLARPADAEATKKA